MMPTVTGLAMLLVSALPGRAADVTAAGLWQKTEDGKPVIWVLMVDHHDGMFEGVIAKTFPLDPNEICSKCTDDRKNAPVAGISFIRNMKRNGLEYEGGNVLDPRNGDVWKAKMSVSPDGQALTLRGYILTPPLGKNETWQRCRTPNSPRSIPPSWRNIWRRRPRRQRSRRLPARKRPLVPRTSVFERKLART